MPLFEALACMMTGEGEVENRRSDRPAQPAGRVPEVRRGPDPGQGKQAPCPNLSKTPAFQTRTVGLFHIRIDRP